MVRNNITRCSRIHDCGCVYEEVSVWDDANENIIEPPKFLLMNKICNIHAPMASTEHKANHAELSKGVLDFIEEAKTRNLKQVDDMISRETDPSKLHDLVLCRVQVVQHNEKITREWNALVTWPHAFDSHIHEHIKRTNGEWPTE